MATGTQKLLPRKRTTHVAMERPNIVWITLDSVRADHTTLDGYDRETTPELERIGRDGHAFRNCIAHSLSTLPSTGAMMSGYPPLTQHRRRRRQPAPRLHHHDARAIRRRRLRHGVSLPKLVSQFGDRPR
ncbi:sulfatase-like hydrolase/transferase [Haloarcula regularis]|uniref:sulfatase-like hydrolase/transferase n=1 Tax=Haloarcula regularis TaxID=3033392 RepID=UPI0023E7C0C0|nr:sulfatase-like hydrolase/transferase [Halomicroarcula sp. SYNS111]